MAQLPSLAAWLAVFFFLLIHGRHAQGETYLQSWSTLHNGPGNLNDRPATVATDGDGNVFVTGHSRNASGNDDYYTAKLHKGDGHALWEVRYDGTGASHDRPTALVVDADGNVIVTGFSRNASGDDDYYTAKLDGSDGTLLWEHMYDGPGAGHDQASAIAVDASGDVIVTGWSRNAAGNDDYATLRLEASTGTLLWTHRYDGTGSGTDRAVAVALDAAGDVFVTGYTRTAAGNDDYGTIKIEGGTGAGLWTSFYDGPGSSTDRASALAVDAGGNVIVTGASRNAAGNNDYYTTKLDGSAGTALWSTRYNGPANDADSASAVAVDGSGNVFVTGSSWNGSNFDYRTAKHDGGDGHLLWEHRLNGPASSTDAATRLALDSAGNAAVTGYSWNTLNADFLTVLYAGGTGSVLWSQRYNGPGRADDNATALAVDADGHIIVCGETWAASNANFATVKYVKVVPPSPVLVGTGTPAIFTVDAGAGLPMTYRWSKSAAVISGATGSSYTIPSTSLAAAGSYTVTVSNSTGTVTTPAASLGVINRASTTTTVNEGTTATLTLGAAGQGLTFQWFKGITPLANGGRISGATTSILRITGAVPADAAAYTCRVTMGSLTLDSGTFTLAVRLRPVLDPFAPGPWIVSGSTTATPTATNGPTAFLITGLPPGLTYNTATGQISGRPLASGAFNVRITASNLAGSSDAQSVVITVDPLDPLAVGTFTGLVEREPDLNNDLGGTFSLTTTSTGSCSGRFTLGARSYTFASRLDAFLTADPTCSATVPRAGLAPLTVAFSISIVTGTLTGTVSDGIHAPVAFSANRIPWHATLNPASDYAGTYTNALELDAGLSGDPAYPQGTGYGILMINNSGTAAWSGRLADGSGVASSTSLGYDGTVPVHWLLYSATGSAQGSLQVTPDPFSSFADNTVDGFISWMKGAQTSTSVRSYRDGFPLNFLTTIGGKYAAPSANVIILGLPNQADNARLSFAEGGIGSASFAATLDRPFRITTGNVALMNTGASNPAHLALTITPVTGVLSGSFTLQDINPLNASQTLSRLVTFRGLLVPRLGVGVGHFQLPQLPDAGPPVTTLGTSPILSGQMILEEAP